MKGFQEKRKFKKILYSNISIFLLLVVIVFLGRSLWSSWQKYSLTKNSREQSEAKLDELQRQRNLLEERTEKLDSDRGREEILRERYDIAKDGEELINIVEVTD